VFYANIEKLLLSGIGDDSISQNNLRGKTLKVEKSDKNHLKIELNSEQEENY
jgi:hypothetical protein